MKKVYYSIRFLIILFALFAFINYGRFVSAASEAEVYANDVTIKAGDDICIPVYIRNNPGLMGYVITAQYNMKKLELSEISAGEICQNGIFDDNLSVNKKGKVEILWSYTKEIKEDGTLFFLKVKAKKDITKLERIQLSVQKDETFNEKYESVNLLCKDIEIFGGEKTVIEEDKLEEGNEDLSDTKNQQKVKKEDKEEVNIEDGKKDVSIQENADLQQEKKDKSIKKEEKKKVEESESISGKSIKIEDVIQKKSTSADETKEMQGNQFLIISIIGIVLLALVTILFFWRIKLKK